MSAVPDVDLGKESKNFRVSADEVLTNYAFQLTLVVLGLIVVGGFASWLLSFAAPSAVPPTAPSVPATAQALEDYKTLVDRYKDLSGIQIQRFTDTFQLIVVTALLPILTALLGYMFGKRSA